MTARDDFNRTVSDWLDEAAGRGTPDYLDAVLAQTTRTRQRPAWSSLERWLPMAITFRARVAPIPRLAWAVVLLALLVLAVVALLAAGFGQRRLPHFGAAANGGIAFVDGSSMKVAGADGLTVRTVASLPDGAERLTFSPDGTRLAYDTSGAVPSLVIADADGSHPVVVASGSSLATGLPLAWSPDSRRLAFTLAIVADKIGTIEVVDSDGSHVRQIIEGPAAAATDRYAPAWSPDGQWISFFSTETTGTKLNVIHPDGSGAQAVKTSPINPDLGQVSWSPDPGQRRLVYVAGGYVKMVDLATATEIAVGTGFWPTWSPDGHQMSWWNNGTQLVPIADVLAGKDRPTMVFPAVTGARCQDNPGLAGKAICSPALWSPDGAWIFGPDVVGKAIVFGRVDGSSPPRAIALEHPIDLAAGPGQQVAWQAVAP
ncbi:MAG TPA: hypothetical protein VIL81_02835, partial [Candidatus Limnocylindrales bacterium]|jgi:hypothetical protein